VKHTALIIFTDSTASTILTPTTIKLFLPIKIYAITYSGMFKEFINSPNGITLNILDYSRNMVFKLYL